MEETTAETRQDEWIASHDISAIEGALKPGAYVARAYNFSKKHYDATPDWARKDSDGKWLFSLRYIESDAKHNIKIITVSEAARHVGATRKAVQNWIDEGLIATDGGKDRKKGESREILRVPFMQIAPELKKKLETPAVVGHRLKHGQFVPEEIREKFIAEHKPVKSIKQKAAQKIEEHLRKAKRIIRKKVKQKKKQEDLNTEEKAVAARKIEERLNEAKEKKKLEVAKEKEAEAIAKKLQNDMLDDKISRIDAAVLFNEIASKQDIPGDIQIKTIRKYFGKEHTADLQ